MILHSQTFSKSVSTSVSLCLRHPCPEAFVSSCLPGQSHALTSISEIRFTPAPWGRYEIRTSSPRPKVAAPANYLHQASMLLNSDMASGDHLMYNILSGIKGPFSSPTDNKLLIGKDLQ